MTDSAERKSMCIMQENISPIEIGWLGVKKIWILPDYWMILLCIYSQIFFCLLKTIHPWCYSSISNINSFIIFYNCFLSNLKWFFPFFLFVVYVSIDKESIIFVTKWSIISCRFEKKNLMHNFLIPLVGE